MKYYLAPMEGITGYVFRGVYHSCFPAMDKYFTPFLSPNENGKLSPREYRDVNPAHNQGMYVVPQILTNKAPDFIRTAKTLRDMGYREVNLNLGCPSKTVVSRKRGAGFLAFPREVDQCLYEIFAGLDMKISVKTRIGKENPEEFYELLDIYNRYSMEELIIHPRVQKDLYKNTPRMEIFQYGFDNSKNPVCYNGDLYRPEDGDRIREKFPGLSAMMLGRGIVSYPGLLREMKQDCDLTASGKPVSEEEEERTVRNRIREFHDRLYEGYRNEYLAEAGPKVVLFKMKEIWCYLITAFEGGEKPGKKIKKAQNLRDYEGAVSVLFECCTCGRKQM